MVIRQMQSYLLSVYILKGGRDKLIYNTLQGDKQARGLIEREERSQASPL